MKQVKLLMLLCAIIIPGFAIAGEYNWLTFRMIDNTEVSVAVNSLSISYSEGILHLASPAIDRDLSVDELKSMQFTSSPSSIDALDGEDIFGEIEFFTLSGVKAGSFLSVEEAIEELPSGAYIIKSGNKTHKVIF